MINLVIHNEIDSDRQKAIAAARMISYAADDASELGLRECSQLLYFAVDLIKMKFIIKNKDVLLEFGIDANNRTRVKTVGESQ